MAVSATLRRTRRLLACVPLVCLLAAVPTAALARSPRGSSDTDGSSAGSGGVGVTGGSGVSQPGSTTTPSIVPGIVRLAGVLNASGDGITFTVAASGTLGHPLRISGSAPASSAGALIYIESANSGRTNWTQVATAVIAPDGSFSARWTPSTSAKLALRAVLAPGTTPDTGTSSSGSTGTSSSGSTGLSGSGSTGVSGSGSASTASGQLVTSALTIPIFRDAGATLYGPGFWGHRTACGERLTRATLGVASRTLKCGTQVAVLYRGRELTVPVIDRGPFHTHARWDLTLATAKALGIGQTVTIGTLTAGSATALAARS